MRILIPLIAALVGVAVFFAVIARPPTTPPPSSPTASAAEVAPAAPPASPTRRASADDAPAPDASTTDAPAAAATAQAEPADAADAPAPAPALPALRAVEADAPLAPSLGSADPNGAYNLEASFTAFGAGLTRITLADYAQHIERDDRYVLLDAFADTTSPPFYPLAARSITVNGQSVNLAVARWAGGAVEDHGTGQRVRYELEIVDDQDRPVARLDRVWSLPHNSFDLSLDQRIVNLTDGPLDVRFEQNAHGDVINDDAAYLGDYRRFVTGYFFLGETPPKTNLYINDALHYRTSIIDEAAPPLWPNAALPDARQPTLAWLASENRYFTVITHTLPDDPAQPFAVADIPELGTLFPQVTARVHQPGSPAASFIFTMASAPLRLEPGQAADLGLAVFAGPRERELFNQEPYRTLGFDLLIRYELGCTWCTFQWLAKLLLSYLTLLHDYVVFDWGVAIIVLVITVRLLLHPITKKSQAGMMKMGKQMAALQPEMQKLKQKYKDDPQSLNKEMMALYREKGINPANMLGCLPMLLQTPIWIALYAMLYFAIELRHQPAFYGIFQAVSGGGWHFLEDLSVADHFLKFSDQGITLNLLFIYPTFTGINILPLLMAVVMYFNMKLTTPPPATEEQKQQQKIMRIMPFIFPIFLYSAPSGLTLYITASTLAGIVDSWIVRRHVRQQEEAGELFKKKEVKPGSLRWKLQQRFELAQQMAQRRMEEAKKQQAEGKGGAGGYKSRKKR